MQKSKQIQIAMTQLRVLIDGHSNFRINNSFLVAQLYFKIEKIHFCYIGTNQNKTFIL